MNCWSIVNRPRVAPRRGAWIETSADYSKALQVLVSHPAGVRGLKHPQVEYFLNVGCTAGVRIETQYRQPFLTESLVAPAGCVDEAIHSV